MNRPNRWYDGVIAVLAPILCGSAAIAFAPHGAPAGQPAAAKRLEASREVRSLDGFVPEVPERLEVGDEVGAAVEGLLGSLTKEDFARREQVVAALADADVETAAGLAAVAQDETSPLRPRARYMIRRVFDRVGPRLLEQAVDAEEPQKTRGEQVFLVLADVAPLEQHNHGGWQKRGICYEQLGYPAKAAEAYRLWVPGGSGCGTCDASIANERVVGMVRCLKRSKQYNEASQLVWSHLRQTDAYLAPPSLLVLLHLVEIYEAQGKLEQVAEELRNVPTVSTDAWNAVKEYVAIRKDLAAKRWDRLIPHLYDGFTRRPRSVNDVLFDLRRSESTDHWKVRVVAEGMRQFPEQTAPLLIEQLRLAEAREPEKHFRPQYSQLADPTAVAGIVYALLHVQTPEAVVVVRRGGYLNWGSGEKHAIVREFLAVRCDGDSRALLRYLEGDAKAFDTLTVLVELGVDEAVEPLIQYLDDPFYAHGVLYTLWRRTGVTLGTDRVLAEYHQHQQQQQRTDLLAAVPDGRLSSQRETQARQPLRAARDRWLAWWQFEGAALQPKPPGWWQTPDAAPLLLKALESPSRAIRRAAQRDLRALEHPVLVDMSDELDRSPF